jgi:transcriptional regulator with XRE-family HTH domain
MLIEALKRAIDADPRTEYRIAADASVNRSILTRLQTGERSPSIETIERLADALGYDVRLVKRRKQKGH